VSNLSIGQPVATGAVAIPARRRTPEPITGGMRGTSMNKDEYRKLLLHPNWQKKRLEILERDGFACRECGDVESTLHVHHQYYKKDAPPWDYPDESLLTLCEACHEFEHQSAARISRDLIVHLRSAQLRLGEIELLIHSISVMPSDTRMAVMRSALDVIHRCGIQSAPHDEFVAFAKSFYEAHRPKGFESFID
jgi:hypothetical protein